jgi:hypothetical protein
VDYVHSPSQHGGDPDVNVDNAVLVWLLQDEARYQHERGRSPVQSSDGGKVMSESGDIPDQKDDAALPRSDGAGAGLLGRLDVLRGDWDVGR